MQSLMFSNVISKHLHTMIQSHTGCIYLTFLHCTVYSCTAVCFQKGSQIACMKRCIVTLIAYIWHFSAVCFQMSAQTARMGRCKVTLFTLVWLVFTVPLYMSSQRDWLRAPLWLFSRVCIYSHWISYTDLVLRFNIFIHHQHLGKSWLKLRKQARKLQATLEGRQPKLWPTESLTDGGEV